MYKDVAKNLKQFKIKPPTAFLPKPTEADYANGFIRRYFVRKSNDKNSFVYEVSKDTFDEYSRIVWWKTTSIKWKLIGTPDEIRESNTNAIGFVASDFPSISLYIPNLTQFYREPK